MEPQNESLEPQNEHLESPTLFHCILTLHHSGFPAFHMKAVVSPTRAGTGEVWLSHYLLQYSIGLWGVQAQGPSWNEFPFTLFISPEPITPIIFGCKQTKELFNAQKCQHFEIVNRELAPFPGFLVDPPLSSVGMNRWSSQCPAPLFPTNPVFVCRRLLCSNNSGSGGIRQPTSSAEALQAPIFSLPHEVRRKSDRKKLTGSVDRDPLIP